MSKYSEPIFYITGNVMGNKRFKGFRIRNLIEAACYCVVIYYLISLIPFVLKVQIIVTACLCVVVFGLTIIGYKDQSPSEFILNKIDEHKYIHNYHMRSINDVEGKEIFKESDVQNESIADRLIKKIKEYKESRKQ